MENQWNKTPYNSIYEPIRKTAPRKSGSQLCCCLHGSQCILVKSLSSDALKTYEEQYVNLLSPSKEEKMASQLTNKLNKLTIDDKKKIDLEHFHPQKVDPLRQKEMKLVANLFQSVETDQLCSKIGSTSEDPPTSARLPPSTMTTVLPPTESSFSKMSTTKSTPTEPVVPDNFRSSAASIYLGVMSKFQAEQQVANSTEFAIYHHVMNNAKLDMITDGLPLILVYKTSSNNFKHYPIRTTASGGGDVQYFVDYGRASVRKHWSLNQLVKYYQTHVSFDPSREEADIFSYWQE